MDLPPLDPSASAPASGSRRSKKKRRKKEQTTNPEIVAPPQIEKLREEGGAAAGPTKTSAATRKITIETEPLISREGRINFDVYVKHAEQAISEKGPDCPEILYVLTIALSGQKKIDEGIVQVDKLLEKIPETHPLYASACMLKGRLVFMKDDTNFSECSLRWFQRAYHFGHPDAAKYMFLAKSGMVLGGISLVKWCNYFECLKIIRSYPKIYRSFTEKMARFFSCSEPESRANPSWLACKLFETIDGKNNDLVSIFPDDHIEFCRAMCDQMLPERASDAKEALREYFSQRPATREEKMHPSFLAPESFVHFHQIPQEEKYAPALARCNSEIDVILAAKALQDMNAQRFCREIEQRYSAPYSMEVPEVYEYLHDLYLAQNKIEKAIHILQKGIEKLNNFLAGRGRLYLMTLGQQAEFIKITGWPEHACAEMELEEVVAAENKLRRLELKLELLSEGLPKSVQPVSDTKDTSASVQVYVHEAVTQKPEQTPVQSEPDDSGVCASKAASSPQTSDEYPQPLHEAMASKTAKPSQPVQSEVHIRNGLNQAIQLMELQAEFDEAFQVLDTLKPPTYSPQWFQKKQALCWLMHNKSDSYDYLKTQVGHDEPAAKKGKALLQKAKTEIKKLLHALEKLVVDEHPDLKHENSFCQDQASAMRFAEALSQDGKERLRRQYGSLYSTLAHINKKLKDNPLTQEPQYQDDAIRYFGIANRIRGRRS